MSLPEDLLGRLDDEARQRSTSRSALLVLAARRELERRDPAGVRAAIARSRERFPLGGAVGLRRAGPIGS